MGLEKFGVRALVTVLFGPFIIFCAWKGGYLFLALIVSIVSLGMYEFYDLATQKVTRPEKVIGIVSGITLCLMLYYNQLVNLWIVVSISMFVLVVFELFRNEVGPILNTAATLMGLFYVSFFLGFLILIRELPGQLNMEYQLGGSLIILIFLSIWLCDTAAYLFGSRFGKHKLFQRVSPNKTVEGTILGFIFAVLTAYACYLTFLQQINLVNVLVIGAVCGSVGQISDLLESLFKRDARVKDSSNLIPGHGGILDRFDSEILVAPVIYFYLRFIVF